MESPSPKRRKTSPSTSLEVDANNPSIRLSSRDARSLTPSRASYRSPTKASLARFNPNLLPSSSAAATKRPSSRGSQARDTSWSIANNGAQGSVDGIDTAARQVTPSRAVTPATVEINGRIGGGSPIRNIQSLGGGLSAALRRRSRTSSQYASPPKRAPDNTRASPPAAMEIDLAQGTVNEMSGQEQAPNMVERSNDAAESEAPGARAMEQEEFDLPSVPRSLENGVIHESRTGEDGEPRLPSTPTQLGLEPPPEPPKGFLLSSPSRRPKRKIRNCAKSSPLKPRSSATQEVIVDGQERSSLGPRKYYSHIQEATNSDNAISSALQHTKPDSLTHRLSLFLPFSKSPPPTLPRPPTPPRVILDTLPDAPNSTSNAVTAAENSIKTTPSDDPQLRRKEITFTSPRNLLMVKIHLTVNLSTNKTTDIALTRISSWAATELGTWLQKSMVNRDLATIRDDINHYWRLSETRAKCWIQCEEEFGHLLSESISIDTHVTEHSETTSGKRPKGRQKVDNPTSSSALEHISARQSLHHHLGRTSLLFAQSPASLLISWKLVFDTATGKLESHISAHAAFPNSWIQAEGGSELARVGDAFDELLRAGQGVFEAVAVVAGLILY